MSMLKNSLRRRGKTFTEGSLQPDEKKSSFENLVKKTLRISRKENPTSTSSETEFTKPEPEEPLDQDLLPHKLESSILHLELKKKEIHLHNGEHILKKLRAVALLVKTAEVNYILPKGDLYVTNYQLVFKSRIIDHLSQVEEETPFPVKDKNANEVLNIETTIYVPYMLMNYLHRKTLGKQEQLKIYCYDMRDLKFIASSKKANFLAKVIEDYISLPENSIEKLFAFHYKWIPPTDIMDGWKFYNIETEFFRMGIPDADWKLVDWNRNFEIASTYPPIWCVPSSMTEEEIKAVADFRSKGRIPVCCWKSPTKKATISRCSQPYVGLIGRTSKEDEKLMKEIYNTNERENSVLHIMDARPKANAVGNKAKGLGYEYNSETSRINFMGIDNIHAVRESFVKMFELLNKDNVDNGVWFATLEATGWLRHISTIVGGSVDVVKRIIAGDSVLIHCSDGWDRTSQISSLAQLLLDPFYRTLEGIEILIEKEWLSFGHKFGERCGQAGKENERSPIFLQWLDCIHQIMHQFPISFEFNSHFLLTLADEVYTCRFGTFLFNSYAERVQAKLAERTVSIWSFINANAELYKNMFYQPRTDPIIPSFSTRRLVVWEDFFFRHETPWKQKEDPLEVATEMVQKLEEQLNSVNKQTKKQEQSHWKQLVELMTQERRARKRQAELEAKIVIETVLNSVFEHIEAVMQHDMMLINDDTKSEMGTDLESKHGGKRPNWIPDAWAPACHKCKKGFTQIRRKHHCRACGNVFCNTCSANKLALPSFMYFDPVRVCDKCFGTLEEDAAVELP